MVLKVKHVLGTDEKTEHYRQEARAADRQLFRKIDSKKEKHTMKHNYLNPKQAHKYVADNAEKGKDIFWDGWDIVIFKRNPSGYMVKNGMFRNGQWGTTRRVKVSDRGTWRLPVTP